MKYTILHRYNCINSYRLVTLACHVSCPKMTVLSLEGERYPSNGRHLKPFIAVDTLRPVTSGATDVCCMRYGAWVKNHSRSYQMPTYVKHGEQVITLYTALNCDCVNLSGNSKDRLWIPPPSTSWMSTGDL